MSGESDVDLRERFRELRERDSTATPALDYVLMRAGTQTQRGWPGLAWTVGGFALAMAGVFFLFLRPPAPSPDAATVTLPAWPRQTEFLLARASDPSQHLNWSPSPTSGLGQPTFSRYSEGK